VDYLVETVLDVTITTITACLYIYQLQAFPYRNESAARSDDNQRNVPSTNSADPKAKTLHPPLRVEVKAASATVAPPSLAASPTTVNADSTPPPAARNLLLAPAPSPASAPAPLPALAPATPSRSVPPVKWWMHRFGLSHSACFRCRVRSTALAGSTSSRMR
jgi:hypothetical protein